MSTRELPLRVGHVVLRPRSATTSAHAGEASLRSIARFASALILLILVLSTFALAQAPVTASGRVTGRQGEAKQFASVSFDGPGRYVALTDATGNFAIPGVTPGKYTVRVRQGNQVEEFTRNVGSGRIDLVVKW